MVLASPWPNAVTDDFAPGLALGLALMHGFVWSSMALISFMPPFVRQWRILITALAVMAMLVATAFIIGVAQGFNLGAAKLYTLVFVIPAMWSLRWRLVSS